MAASIASVTFAQRVRLWLGLTAFWAVQGLISAQAYVEWGDPLGHALEMAMATALLWVPVSFWALYSAARFPLGRGRFDRVLWHAGSCIGVCVFRAAGFLLLNPLVGWERDRPTVGKALFMSFEKNFMFYLVILGAAHAFHFARRAREREQAATRLEAQLVGAQLAALKAQLQPHFLFNALQSIAELLHRDIHTADTMLMALSRLLRRSLEADASQVVALADELRTLAPYLELEQLRFGDRLRISVQVAPELLEARVPHLILQPLVENALRHGLAPRAAKGSITICAQVVLQQLELEVRDDGVGLREPLREGVGLRNTRARLASLYGSRHEFALRNAPAGGCSARLLLPLSSRAS